ncbi:thioesterase, partial [Mycobacterium adipatum]
NLDPERFEVVAVGITDRAGVEVVHADITTWVTLVSG